MAGDREYPNNILAELRKAKGTEDETYTLGLGLFIRWEKSVGQRALQAKLALW